MTQPDTCGAAGGAISMWLNVIDCNNNAGIVSSTQLRGIGSLIFCLNNNIQYDTHVLPIFTHKL